MTNEQRTHLAAFCSHLEIYKPLVLSQAQVDFIARLDEICARDGVDDEALRRAGTVEMARRGLRALDEIIAEKEGVK